MHILINVFYQETTNLKAAHFHMLKMQENRLFNIIVTYNTECSTIIKNINIFFKLYKIKIVAAM